MLCSSICKIENSLIFLCETVDSELSSMREFTSKRISPVFLSTTSSAITLPSRSSGLIDIHLDFPNFLIFLIALLVTFLDALTITSPLFLSRISSITLIPISKFSWSIKYSSFPGS